MFEPEDQKITSTYTEDSFLDYLKALSSNI